MENFKTIFGVFAGCLSVTFIAWLIVHFNGKTILSIIDSVFSLSDKLQNKSKYSKKNWLQVATEAEIIILGLTPLAIASLVSTSQGKCYNSVATFTINEAIILCLFLLNSKSANWSNNLFGKDFVCDRFLVFILAIIWCLVFSIWGFVAIDPGENYGIDRLLVNRNGDMWFYTRRFAAYIFSNLNFDSQPACSYLQISPKKFSSFIGSLLVYVSANTVFGITLFQGLAGCSLFLSLFGNWPKFTYRGKSLSGRGTFFAVIWAIASDRIS